MLTQKDSDMAQVINLMTQLQRTEFALDQAKAVTRKHWEAMLAAEAQEGEARQAYIAVRSEVERLMMQGLQAERVSITPAGLAELAKIDAGVEPELEVVRLSGVAVAELEQLAREDWQAEAEADRIDQALRTCHQCSAQIGETGVVDSETGDWCAECYLALVPAEPEPAVAEVDVPSIITDAAPTPEQMSDLHRFITGNVGYTRRTFATEVEVEPAPAPQLVPAPVLKTTAEWQAEREVTAPSVPIKPRMPPAFSFKQDPPPYFAVDMAKVCTVDRGRVARAEIHEAMRKHKITESSINVYLRRMVAQGQLQQIGTGHFAHKDWRRS